MKRPLLLFLFPLLIGGIVFWGYNFYSQKKELQALQRAEEFLELERAWQVSHLSGFDTPPLVVGLSPLYMEGIVAWLYIGESHPKWDKYYVLRKGDVVVFTLSFPSGKAKREWTNYLSPWRYPSRRYDRSGRPIVEGEIR